MCCYVKRIAWIRARLQSETETQVKEKSVLRRPHDDKASELQWKVLSRSHTITALLTMLNDERNKLRETPKTGSHPVTDKWTKHEIVCAIAKLTRELDGIHPYPKLYVVVDEKLSPVQKGVQAAHAMTALFKKHGILDHSALVFLQAPFVSSCFHALGGLKREPFYEPYWGDKLTAVAIEPLEEEQVPEALRKLQLAC